MSWFKIKSFIRFYLLAFLTALIFLVFTILVFLEVLERVEERNLGLFNHRVQTVNSSIEKRMLDYIQILKGVRGFYEVSDSVSRDEWQNYIASLQVNENYPGILGIGFSFILPKENLAEFENLVKEKEYSTFRVWPKDDREAFTTILFLEPLNELNSRAIGYDMFSDSVRREAMVRARDTGNPALTGMVKLVQETNVGVQNGFLLYLPVYMKGSAILTKEDKKKNIIGYTYSPFRVNDLINGIFGGRYPDIDIEIFDGAVPNPSTLLYDRDTTYSYGNQSGLSRLSLIEVAGHTWLVHVAVRPGFGSEVSFPWFILGGGIIISFLLFLIMYSVANIRRSTYLNQLITDNATAALFIVNREGVITFMNPASEFLTGYSIEEAKNKTFHSLLHHTYSDGSHFPVEDCPIVKALESRNSLYNHEGAFFHKNGDLFHGSLNAQPVLERGRVVSHLIELRDVSQEKQAEVALKDTNRNLQILNNIGKSLAAELDLKKLIQLITDSCTNLCGAEAGAFYYNKADEDGSPYMLHALSGSKGEMFKSFLHPEKVKIFKPIFLGEAVIRSNDITKDTRYDRGYPDVGNLNGQFLVKSYLAVPVLSRGGQVLGGLFFGHSKKGVFTRNAEDVVRGIAAQAAIALDNSQLFEKLSQKNKELIRINNDLDNFVYTASHDLKAPVLNIEGLINVLVRSLEQNKPDRIDQIIGLIKLSVIKFKETILALTDVSKINKNFDDELEKIDIKEIFEDVITSIKSIIEETRAEIKANIECREVNFTKPNMRSILYNLLTNAIKYRNPALNPVIQIKCWRENDQFFIQVSDNGLGIPENQLSKIFVMFKRYHSHIDGTGIGLYLVKRITENYGGEISVASEVEVGTTFTLRIPDL